MPDIPAHEFPCVYRRRAQVAEYLNRVFKHKDCQVIHVDFDLAVAYFLQHTNHLKLGDIPISINKVLDDFSILEPLTGRQDSLLECAHHIHQTLVHHASSPGPTEPFALRYPNLGALNKLAIERTISPTIVGQKNAVVFVDLAGRVVAVSVPPKISDLTSTLSGQVMKSPFGDTVYHMLTLTSFFLRPQERGRVAFEGAAKVNNLPILQGPINLHTDTPSGVSPSFDSPYHVSETASSRLSGADSSFLEVPGCFSGEISSQAVGYGRYSVSLVILQ
jgi:hypothetical protein